MSKDIQPMTDAEIETQRLKCQSDGDDRLPWCVECERSWPCPTARLIAAVEALQGGGWYYCKNDECGRSGPLDYVARKREAKKPTGCGAPLGVSGYLRMRCGDEGAGLCGECSGQQLKPETCKVQVFVSYGAFAPKYRPCGNPLPCAEHSK